MRLQIALIDLFAHDDELWRFSASFHCAQTAFDALHVIGDTLHCAVQVLIHFFRKDCLLLDEFV